MVAPLGAAPISEMPAVDAGRSSCWQAGAKRIRPARLEQTMAFDPPAVRVRMGFELEH